MCSMQDGLNQLKLHFTNSQSFDLTKSNEADDPAQWGIAISFVLRFLAFIAVLALLVVVVLMILKYLRDFEDERTVEGAAVTETNPLQPAKAIPFTYGTCDEDLESGICSSSTSEEDLYDGKICIICYDELRNCFFVPCGHCATCYICAQRIFNGENKTCPVCRRFIRKVRKLFAP